MLLSLAVTEHSHSLDIPCHWVNHEGQESRTWLTGWQPELKNEIDMLTTRHTNRAEVKKPPNVLAHPFKVVVGAHGKLWYKLWYQILTF
jgi:hypothetical protein